MAIGIRLFFRKSASQQVAASTALVDCTDLSCPVAASQTLKVKFWIPFTVGATGGFKFQVVVPAGGTNFTCSLFAFDGITAAPGSQVGIVQTASAAFANAWAVAGNHMMLIEADVENGATAGTVKLQFACNSAANGITVIEGASMEVIKL